MEFDTAYRSRETLLPYGFLTQQEDSRAEMICKKKEETEGWIKVVSHAPLRHVTVGDSDSVRNSGQQV